MPEVINTVPFPLVPAVKNCSGYSRSQRAATIPDAPAKKANVEARGIQVTMNSARRELIDVLTPLARSIIETITRARGIDIDEAMRAPARKQTSDPTTKGFSGRSHFVAASAWAKASIAAAAALFSNASDLAPSWCMSIALSSRSSTRSKFRWARSSSCWARSATCSEISFSADFLARAISISRSRSSSSAFLSFIASRSRRPTSNCCARALSSSSRLMRMPS